MPETVDRDLMVLVERVVRPLSVSPTRRMRIRTELLQHLQEIYAEESARDGDASAALARTRERFGEPEDLTADLRSSIRRWEPYLAWYQSFFLPGDHESLVRYVGRLVLGFMLYFSALSIVTLGIAHLSQGRPIAWFEIRVVVGLCGCLSMWLGSFLLFGFEAGAAWDRLPRPWGRVLGCIVGLLASWPVSLGVLLPLLTGEWAVDAASLVRLILGGVFTAICGLVVGVLHQRDLVRHRQWSELEIAAT